MIIKSYEIEKNISKFLDYNFFLLYGENLGLKKDINNSIKLAIKKQDVNLEFSSIFENEITENEEAFYNSIYSGSLFGNIPCYLENDRGVEIIAVNELKKNNITLSRECINLLIEKSNSDRNNLKNEIEKIKSFSLNKKKIELEELKSIINFSGEYKSDNFINECLCGNISQYKKALSEFYSNAVNQIFLLRILANKIQRLLRMKEIESDYDNIDSLLNSSKPPIFWKEKPMIKKQLIIWNSNALKKMIQEINHTELLCKKNPQTSRAIFFNFFGQICKKANNYS